jgi:hypothetical protein
MNSSKSPRRAVAQATGGSAGLFAGGGSANATVFNGGTAVAQATGGSVDGFVSGGFANATATSTAMLGGGRHDDPAKTERRSTRTCRAVVAPQGVNQVARHLAIELQRAEIART